MKKLEAIEQRVSKATKGPWILQAIQEESQNRYIVANDGTLDIEIAQVGAPFHDDEPTALFIAHSREDIPLLLEVVKAAQVLLNNVPCSDPDCCGAAIREAESREWLKEKIAKLEAEEK